MTPIEPIATTEVLTVSCSLIVTRRNHTEILLLDKGMEHCLPSIEIPRLQRPAPHINDILKRVWGVESVCLFAAGAASDPEPESTRRCYVVEALGSGSASRHDSNWTSVQDLRSRSLLGANDTRTLISALEKARAFEADGTASLFVRSGWFEGVTTWVREQVSQRGWLLGERWTQYVMGPDFALIRFDTTGPAVWFKAAGGTGTAEYAISLALAGLESPYLPEHLGENAEWKSWLMADAPGCRLAESERLQAWTTTASSLAALQIHSFNFAERLIAAGCHDCRTPQLEEMIDPFIAVVADLMVAQPQSPPQVLTDKELGTVAAFLRDGCALLDTLPILPCLGHGDLNPGNVIVDGKKAVLLDWAAGMVGHPFFSCEYLLALFRRLHPKRSGWADAIRSAYFTPWRQICPAEAVEQSLTWIPLLAPFAWALRLWRSEPRTGSTEAYTARLLRSVARRIHSEATLLAQRVSESNSEERR